MEFVKNVFKKDTLRKSDQQFEPSNSVTVTVTSQVKVDTKRNKKSKIKAKKKKEKQKSLNIENQNINLIVGQGIRNRLVSIMKQLSLNPIEISNNNNHNASMAQIPVTITQFTPVVDIDENEDISISNHLNSKDYSTRPCKTCTKQDRLRTISSSITSTSSQEERISENIAEKPKPSLNQQTYKSSIPILKEHLYQNESIFEMDESMGQVDELNEIIITKSPTIISEKEDQTCFIHFLALKPSADLFLRQKNNPKLQLVLRWNFLNYYDELILDVNERCVFMDVQRVYHFILTKGYYIYLYSCPLSMELFAESDDHSTLLGRCDLNLHLALVHINQTFISVIPISNKLLVACYPEIQAEGFGFIRIAYGFEGNQKDFDKYRVYHQQRKLLPLLGDGRYDVETFSKHFDYQASFSITSISSTNFDQQNLNMILIKNKATRMDQKEISRELAERAAWLRDELAWRLTLQENAMLSGQDPNFVPWRQWKDKNNENVKPRSIYKADTFDGISCDVTIVILDLSINPDSYVANDSTIEKIYIEYSFLNEGEFEESLSKEKPITDTIIIYNFRKTFHVGLEEAKILSKMLINGKSIDITVVGEPEYEENYCQACIELGVAKLTIFDILQNENDNFVESCKIFNEAFNTSIGTLTVAMSGIVNLRPLILRVTDVPKIMT